MKLGNYFLGLALFAVGLTSCDTDNIGTIYDGPAMANISFITDSVDTETEESVLEIPVIVTRNYSEKSDTVDISMTDVSSDNVKLRDSRLIFKAGEQQVNTFVVISDITEGNTYSCNLHLSPKNIATANQFETKIHDMSINVLCRKWNSLGFGHYDSPDWWEEDFDVEIKQAEGTNLYKMIGLFDPDYDIKFEITEDNKVYIEKQASWVHSGYGVVSLMGYAKSDNSGYAGPYNPETKVAKLTLVHTVSAGSFGSYVDYLTMP